MNHFKFELIHKSRKSKARVGCLYTPHGVIDTPNFVAVGTNAALKALDSKMVEEIGLQLMFCNTYHLLLQPGVEIVRKAGGLHKFINRNMPIITDSGGFQVFSLAYGSIADELKSCGSKKVDSTVLKISEEGVLFRSYRDGSKILLTPESSIRAQKALGADIIIPFDELPPYHISPKKLKDSFERTHRWEKRSLEEHLEKVQNQAIYAIIHGGVDKELRKQSCKILSEQPFDGFAIGGSLGKTREEMVDLLRFTMDCLPEDKPNHLLGIGDLKSLEQLIPFGIDTFDSSYPTRAARHGVLLTKKGQERLLKSGNSSMFEPVEKDCDCFTCKHYTLAYLQHLFKAHELSALSLTTIHNLHFMVKLMAQYRDAILNDAV